MLHKKSYILDTNYFPGMIRYLGFFFKVFIKTAVKHHIQIPDLPTYMSQPCLRHTNKNLFPHKILLVCTFLLKVRWPKHMLVLPKP